MRLPLGLRRGNILSLCRSWLLFLRPANQLVLVAACEKICLENGLSVELFLSQVTKFVFFFGCALCKSGREMNNYLFFADIWRSIWHKFSFFNPFPTHTCGPLSRLYMFPQMSCIALFFFFTFLFFLFIRWEDLLPSVHGPRHRLQLRCAGADQEARIDIPLQ